MAITKISNPPDIYPGFNDNFFVVSSTNSGQNQFNYTAQILINGTDQGTLRINSDVNGYGILNLKDYLRNRFSSDSTLSNKFTKWQNSYVQYQINYGEEYFVSSSIENIYQYFDQSTGQTFLVIKPVGSSTFPFAVGDTIRTDFPNSIFNYSGTFKVLNKHNGTTVGTGNNLILSCIWQGTNGDSGTAYAVVKSSLPNLSTETGVAFMAAYAQTVILNYSQTSLDSSFLTNMPTNFKMKLSNRGTLSFHLPTVGVTNCLITTNDNRNYRINNTTLTNQSDISQTFGKIGFAPSNLAQLVNGDLGISNALPVITASTLYYDVTLTKPSGSFQTKRIYIDRTCGVNDIAVYFIDRKGSCVPFNFTGVRRDNVQIKRSVYQTENSYTSIGAEYVFNTEADETTILNTNWLSEADSLYFKEFLTSRFHWIEDGVQPLGAEQITPVTVLTDKVEIQRSQTGLIRYTIEVKSGYKNYLN